jgi:hypothetical protein
MRAAPRANQAGVALFGMNEVVEEVINGRSIFLLEICFAGW